MSEKLSLSRTYRSVSKALMGYMTLNEEGLAAFLTTNEKRQLFH